MRGYRSLAPVLLVIVVAIGLALLAHHNAANVSKGGASYSGSASQTEPPVAEAASASCHMRGLLPDPNCTPGATDPSVTQADLSQTICQRGYTKTVRPPATYTDQLKTEQLRAYGFTDNPSHHEEDHLISLELGGAPSDPKNLWPEPGNSPNPKDKVEDFLHKAVCAGRVSLSEAQRRIATDWTTAENGL